MDTRIEAGCMCCGQRITSGWDLFCHPKSETGTRADVSRDELDMNWLGAPWRVTVFWLCATAYAVLLMLRYFDVTAIVEANLLYVDIPVYAALLMMCTWDMADVIMLMRNKKLWWPSAIRFLGIAALLCGWLVYDVHQVRSDAIIDYSDMHTKASLLTMTAGVFVFVVGAGFSNRLLTWERKLLSAGAIQTGETTRLAAVN